jgi:hypothetical protein
VDKRAKCAEWQEKSAIRVLPKWERGAIQLWLKDRRTNQVGRYGYRRLYRTRRWLSFHDNILSCESYEGSRLSRGCNHHAPEGMGVFAHERGSPVLMGRFKPGDLVRIKDGTHDPDMPDHRVAMIIEDGHASERYSGPYTVVFLGTDIHLKFHEVFLEPFTSS